MFDGEEISGYSKFNTGKYVCSGFTASGSLQTSSNAYFTGVITSPTTVSWNFREREELPTFSIENPTLFDVNGPISFSYTTDGIPCAVFINSSNQLIYAIYTDSAWDQTVIATDAVLVDYIAFTSTIEGSPFIVMDDEETMNAVYITEEHYDSAPGVGDGYVYGEIEYDGESAINPHVASDITTGITYISSYSATGSLILMTVFPDGTESVEVVDDSGVSGYYNDIVLDPITKLPIIVYSDGLNLTLNVAYKTAEGWICEVIDNSGSVGADCCAVMGESGNIFVAYRDYTRVDQSTVKMAILDEGKWTVKTLDSNGNVGRGMSITLGGDEYPHISYYGESFLRIIRYLGETWEIYTLQNGIVPSGNTSIALDLELRPIISFGDSDDSKIIYPDDGELIPDNSTGGDDTSGTPGTSQPADDSTGGGGGCFVATAAFGSMSTSAVVSLTNWRDSALGVSEYGSAVKSLYYVISPSIAEEQGSSVNALIRRFLD